MKKKARKTMKSTPKKKLDIGFPVFLYFFIHPKPNNIGPARQRPRDWVSLIHFSESGRGRGAELLLISFSSTRLHGICNGSIKGMEDKCPHPPQISEFFLFGTGRGHKSVLSSATGIQEI